jgi:biopolymer transport protein TolR
VDSRGRYFLDIGSDTNKPVGDDDLVRLIGAVVRQKPQTMILLRADGRVPYDAVAHGMSLLQGAGASKIGFVTEAPSGGKSARHNPE